MSERGGAAKGSNPRIFVVLREIEEVFVNIGLWGAFGKVGRRMALTKCVIER